MDGGSKKWGIIKKINKMPSRNNSANNQGQSILTSNFNEECKIGEAMPPLN